MRRNVQVLLLVLSGAGVLHISLLTDVCLRFVKEGLRPALVLSGAVLVLLGLVAAARDGFPYDRRRQAGGHGGAGGHGHGHGHDHARGPGIAWLLFFPALSLLFFTPPALGAYTAARETGAPAQGPVRNFPPLPEGSPVPLTLTEFQLRARQDRSRSLEDRTVALMGFVTPAPDGGWFLSRLLVSCCAADSRAVKIRVRGAVPPPADSWVRVTGRRHPGPASGEVAIDAEMVRPVPGPVNPYQDSAPPPTR
ncbi:TIGR03943 family protein [Streptomyces sp. S07_1.15]|uniref:TIGR03943 family putative permease subunit n=1 Tax=Streptomyces sp. S07_1.15 TaxID=2873925 RepID=UPI001D13399A|nr:TIGR03943 family protein [Streptomyces sp. S07_1.15]MCC3650030.1 TIGR03943 family protein [Streptomyces sp. S07_1.15]